MPGTRKQKAAHQAGSKVKKLKQWIICRKPGRPTSGDQRGLGQCQLSGLLNTQEQGHLPHPEAIRLPPPIPPGALAWRPLLVGEHSTHGRVAVSLQGWTFHSQAPPGLWSEVNHTDSKVLCQPSLHQCPLPLHDRKEFQIWPLFQGSRTRCDCLVSRFETELKTQQGSV